ncbi:hypothetical protein ACN47E_007302 [Coniothyrium glycines]
MPHQSLSSSPSTSPSTSPDVYNPISCLAPIRVFLVQTAKGLFSSSGGYKANISLLRHLASRGHVVRQVCYSYHGEVEDYIQTIMEEGGRNPRSRTRVLHLRSKNGKTGTNIKVNDLLMGDGVQSIALDCEAFEQAFGGKRGFSKELGTETASYLETGKLPPRLHDFVSFLQQEIKSFSPTHIVSNDGLTMQATSVIEMPDLKLCRIGIIHTAEQLPFGPYAGGIPGHVSSPSEIKLLKMLDGIWSVSNAIKQYALEHGKLHTNFFIHHPWTYLEEKKHTMPHHLHNWHKNFIGMINPCPVKGARIFTDLARLCPEYDFLAYKSWGLDDTTDKEMRAVKNITLRLACTDMEEAWRDIKILLVPSLWFEAWGIVVIEAHLRGIPVISSDAGALTEAMLGLEHVLSVNCIKGERDEDGVYLVPEQDIEPWVRAVHKLMSDKVEYERLSQKVRRTTKLWLQDMNERGLEEWLIALSNDVARFDIV